MPVYAPESMIEIGVPLSSALIAHASAWCSSSRSASRCRIAIRCRGRYRLPHGERGARGGDGAVDVARVGQRDLGLHRSGRRVVVRVGAGSARRHPLVADEQALRRQALHGGGRLGRRQSHRPESLAARLRGKQAPVSFRRMSATDSAEIRAGLPHPVVDIDGHMIEYFPALSGFLREEGIDLSSPSMRRLVPGAFGPTVDWHSLSAEERARRRVPRPPWWGSPARQHARPGDRDVPVTPARTAPRARHRLLRGVSEHRAHLPAPRRRAGAPRRVPRAEPLQRGGVRRSR